jgi:hypothetical protein
MSQALSRPYSEIIGLQGLQAYAVDAAVVRWGTAFKAALEDAGSNAKTPAEAEKKAAAVVRRWIPSTRQYR